jgi:hypothetical protein
MVRFAVLVAGGGAAINNVRAVLYTNNYVTKTTHRFVARCAASAVVAYDHIGFFYSL